MLFRRNILNLEVGGELRRKSEKNIKCASTVWGSWKTMVRFWGGVTILKMCRKTMVMARCATPFTGVRRRTVATASSLPPPAVHCWAVATVVVVHQAVARAARGRAVLVLLRATS